MSRIVSKNLRKQLKQVKHQHVHEHAQKQDEQQVQPTRDELVNAPNTNATQRGEVNEQHQNVAKPIVQRDPIMFSTTHQETP